MLRWDKTVRLTAQCSHDFIMWFQGITGRRGSKGKRGKKVLAKSFSLSIAILPINFVRFREKVGRQDQVDLRGQKGLLVLQVKKENQEMLPRLG